MTEQFAVLKPLPVNKTVVFYSPVEGDDVLVRTGTIGEGSCFYHSLLHAHSPAYVRLNKAARCQYVKELRQSVAKLDQQSWEQDNDGLTAWVAFQEQVNYFFTGWYKHLKTRVAGVPKDIARVFKYAIRSAKESEVAELLSDLLELHDWESHILPVVFAQDKNRSVALAKRAIESKALSYFAAVLAKFEGLDDERVKVLTRQLKKMVRVIVDLAEKTAYHKYITDLGDVTSSVDEMSIGLISNRFNRDVYFLDGNTRLPYRIGGNGNIKKRKSMIVMWVNQNHYEIVGRLLPDQRVQREFDAEDPLIERMHAYLFEPETVPDKFPALIPYLQKRIRDTLEEKARSPSPAPSDEQNSDYDVLEGIEDLDDEESNFQMTRSPDYGRSPVRASKSPEGAVIDE